VLTLHVGLIQLRRSRGGHSYRFWRRLQKFPVYR